MSAGAKIVCFVIGFFLLLSGITAMWLYGLDGERMGLQLGSVIGGAALILLSIFVRVKA